jgi:hypothetical protein
MDEYYRFLSGTQLEADDRVRLGDQRSSSCEGQGDVASVRTSTAVLTSRR